MREMRDRCRDDIAAPAVLDCHRYVQRYAEVADLARLCQAPDLGDFQVNGVHCTVAMAAKQCVDTGDVFVQYEWQRGSSPDGQAVLIGATGLFDVDIPIADSIHDPNCFINAPARICIGNEDFSVL
mgnify:CR=1 FL=1